MSRFISLSPNEHDEIVGAIYDMIEQIGDVELNNADFYKIEESVSSLVEYLNDGAM